MANRLLQLVVSLCIAPFLSILRAAVSSIHIYIVWVVFDQLCSKHPNDLACLITLGVLSYAYIQGPI